MLIEKEELKKQVQRMLNRKIDKILELPPKEDNSLTGKTSLGVSPISKYRLFFKDAQVNDLIVKSKSSKVILNGIRLLNFERSGKLFYRLIRHHRILGFDRSFLREITFYRRIGKEFGASLPFVYGTYQNRLKNSYMIAMKEFSPVEMPGKEAAYCVLDSILPFHIAFYGKRDSIAKFKLNCYSAKDYKKSRSLLRNLFEGLGTENRDYFGDKLPYLMNFIDTMHQRREALREHFTLTHNDLSPRNLYFDGKGIVLYDWELAAYRNPEHDLVEYLSFVLHEYSDSELPDLMEYHRNKLFTALNIRMSEEDYQKILEFNIAEFIVNKLSVYRRAAKSFRLDFIDDLCRNAARLLGLILERKWKESR